MKTRAITGFFFVLIMLAALLLGQLVFIGFFFFLSLFCLDEFYRLVRTDEVRPLRVAGIALGLSVLIPLSLKHLADAGDTVFLAVVPFTVFICLMALYRKEPKPFHSVAYTILGVVMTVLPFCFYISSAFIDGSYNFHISLGFLLLLWASDTGAYLSGRKFGKHKLFERHSPKKTWEGFLGGLIFSLLVAFLLGIFYTELSFAIWASVSFIVVVFGTFGDLFESMLKRSLSVKDSGNILPGHGGLLDRFDGLLLSAPLVFVLLYLTFNYF